MYAKKEQTYPAYVSKHNSNCDRQVVLLMIPNIEGHEAKSARQQKQWYCLAVKTLSALLRGITINTIVIFIAWIAFIFLQQKTNINRIKEYVNIKIFVTL